MTPDTGLKAVLWNRTITCIRCGCVDMVSSETKADAMDIWAGEGWFIRLFRDDCQARGFCPHCGGMDE